MSSSVSASSPISLLEAICREINSPNDELGTSGTRLAVCGGTSILIPNLARHIAPLLPNVANLSVSNPSKVIARSLVGIFTIWQCRFGLPESEVYDRLALLRGELKEIILHRSSGKYSSFSRELYNITSAEEIYQRVAPMPAKDADRLFWSEVKPLVEKGISTEYACFIVLFTKYPGADFSSLRT